MPVWRAGTPSSPGRQLKPFSFEPWTGQTDVRKTVNFIRHYQHYFPCPYPCEKQELEAHHSWSSVYHGEDAHHKPYKCRDASLPSDDRTSPRRT
ncbi:hypothetical protein BDW75DRAFT_185844 [Aspergillus navahoensis]